MKPSGGTPWAAWSPERPSQAAARRAERRWAWLARRRVWSEVGAWAPWVGGVALLAWVVFG